MYAPRLLSTLVVVMVLALSRPSTAMKLNVTAIGARSGASTLECWQLSAPFTVSSQAGTVGSAVAQLGDAANLTYLVLPATFDGGLHNAPVPQWVVFLSGLAYVTVPNSNSTGAYVLGGELGLIFAADTASVSRKGHRTVYPGNTETVALEIPTKDGKIPPHSVLHSGPCNANEFTGIRGLATSGSN